ncbi:MAG: DUF3179 domain-containing protein [Rhodospirillales bacterium]
MRRIVRNLITCFAVLFMAAAPAFAADVPLSWEREWPNTDFGRTTVDLGEILSGGPPKDGIPAIDDPTFVDVKDAEGLSDTEPVVGLVLGGEAKAYPLRILTWHEIVNDTIGDTPVAVTYCPLCNASIVFDRRLDGQVLDFGTTGKLRYSDLVMYDRQTESWWQQFLGQGIVGEHAGRELQMIPSRLESWSSFRERAPAGKVLVANQPGFRDYGRNPYAGYDSLAKPFLYDGEIPDGVPPMMRVVAVDDKAWSLPLLRQEGRIEYEDLVLTWREGQNSALDKSAIDEGRDVGNVVVQRRAGGNLVDVVHDVTFAFVFHAFRPGGTLYVP